MGCHSAKEMISIDAYSFESFQPPGSKRIANNFFADAKEVRNIDYKEFIYWTEQIYGANSSEYQEIIPDMNVWNTQSLCDSMSQNYLKD